MFYPPFSSDTDSEGDDSDHLQFGDREILEEGMESRGLISQRANPHLSDRTYADGEDLSSNDEEDEIGDEVYEACNNRGSKKRRRLPTLPKLRSGAEMTGRRPDLLHMGSSVATAGEPDSGHNSSIEDGQDS
jgi:hypothetical protein